MIDLAPAASTGQCLLEGNGHAPMGIPAQHRFEAHGDNGPVRRDRPDDSETDLFGRMGPGEALHQSLPRPWIFLAAREARRPCDGGVDEAGTDRRDAHALVGKICTET